MKKSVLILLSLFLVLSVNMSFAGETTLFGPKQYDRTKGKPNVYTDTFPGSPKEGSLIVKNGDQNGGHRVTSALIFMNGQQIFSPSDFKKHVYRLEASIDLAEDNIIKVELRSKPGSYLTIRVTQETPIEVSITSPLDGATVSGPTVKVSGTIINPAGNETGVTVNGMVALVYGDQFVASHVPLQEGANTLTATATDIDGHVVTTSITVSAVMPEDYISLEADPESGTSPLETTLMVDGSFSFTESALTYNGPGEVEIIENPSPEEYRVRMTTEGVYDFTIEVMDEQNNAYTDTVTVVALNKEEFDAMLKAKWEGMNAALAQNDIDSAVSYFDDFSKDSYRAIFNAITSQQRLQITQEFSDIQFIRIMENSAEYDIRTIKDGREYSFYLLFVRDEDGIWKIRSF